MTKLFLTPSEAAELLAITREMLMQSDAPRSTFGPRTIRFHRRVAMLSKRSGAQPRANTALFHVPEGRMIAGIGANTRAALRVAGRIGLTAALIYKLGWVEGIILFHLLTTSFSCPIRWRTE